LTDTTGDVPLHWIKYKVAKDTSVARFVSDLSARLTQLQDIGSKPGSAEGGVWLGGLFQPEAYVTATRQDIAHKNGWSLEQLVLQLDVAQTADQGDFPIRGESISVARTAKSDTNQPGLKLEGADWTGSGLSLNDGRTVVVEASRLSWQRIDACKAASKSVNLPVYLNGDRLDVLFAVDLPSNLSQAIVAQRGVCLIAA
jgi:dynein heavy chain 1